MKPSDEIAIRRLRDAFASPDAAGEPGDACPEPDRIWMAVQGELPHRDTAAVILHTSTCASCAEAWRLAHDVRLESGAAPVAPVAAWRSVWVWGPGLAAAALLVLGVLADRPHRFDGSGSTTQNRDAVDGAVSSLVADGAVLSRDDLVLRWTPGPAGTRYNLRVMTEDLTPVSSAWSLQTPEFKVPATALSPIPAGGKLLWQVDLLAPGQPGRTSRTFIVQLQ